MNQTYRLVWNSESGTYIAVSEATRGRGKAGGKANAVSRTVATTLVVLGTYLGGSVNAESITITETQLTGVVAPSGVDSLSNTGRMAAEGTGVLINGNVTGGMANRGEIASGSGHGIRVTGNVAGGFLNGVGSRLSAMEHGLFVEGSFAGNLENRGNIVSGGLNAVRVEGAFNGNLVNETGALLRGKDAALMLSDLTGNITNRGVIASDGKAIEVAGAMTGNLSNESGARIIGSDAALDVTGNLLGDITNRGDLSSNSSGGATLRLRGDITGNILNAEGARILTARRALDITGVMRGNLTNAGDIIANFGNPAVTIGDGITGNFTNTQTGVVSGGLDDGAITLGSPATEGDLTKTILQGNFENQGLIIAEDTNGAVQFRGNVDGNFDNTSSGRILAKNHALNQSFGRDGIPGEFLGDIHNAGLMSSGYITVRLTGKMTGNFTNTDTGVIHSTGHSGVAFLNNFGFTGNFSNAGTILGNTYAGATVQGQLTPIIAYRRSDQGVQSAWVNDVNVTIPDFIGATPRVGVFIAGGQTGNFSNTGTIRAAQGVFIDGDLTGDWDNTGTISGAFTGLTITEDGDYTESVGGLRHFTGSGSAIVAGNFKGNFRNTVGQTLVVGNHIHNFAPTSTSHTVTRDQVTTSLQPNTGVADLRGKNVAVHLKGAIADGDTWNAIDADNLLVDDGMTITDNSSLFNFTHQIVDGNLQVTAKLTGTAPAPTPSGDVFNGIRRESLASGVTLTGLVENAGDAVFIGGDVTGNLINRGTLNAFEGPRVGPGLRRPGTGLFVNGDVNGDITNAAGAQIWAYENAVYVAGVTDEMDVRSKGNLTGNFTNAGSISTVYGSSALRVDGDLTGDVINTVSGQITSRYHAYHLLGGLTGDFVNEGLIISRRENAVSIGKGMTGSFVNSATGRIYAHSDVLAVREELVGDITNAGEIVSSRAEAFDLSGGMTGNFLNDTTGRIWSENSGIIINTKHDGNFTNLGEIDAGGWGGVRFWGRMTGNFTNGVGARIEADTLGVEFQKGMTGNFVNAGEVTSRNNGSSGFGVLVTEAMTGDFTNAATGLISAAGTGVGFKAGLFGNLTNSGQIRAYSLGGVTATTIKGNVSNTAGAIIDSSGDGLLVTGLLNGSLSNAGRITSLDSRGVNLGGGLTGDMSNSGTIESAASDAVRLSGAQGGTLRNSGRIASLGGAGVNLDTGVAGAQIDNSGTITAATGSSGATAAGTGVYVHAEAGVTGMTNSGTIEGSVNSLNLRNTTGPFAIANTGVLQGDVYLGINTLNLNGEASRVVGNTTNTGGTVNVNGTFTSEGTFNVTNFNVTENGVFNIRHVVTVGNGSGTLFNDGVLATPAQAAAQTVTGHYDQTANGTYRLALADTSTNYGKLAVSGNVKLADASTIDVRLTGTPALSVDTVVRGVITAGGTMTTNANALTVTDNSALFNFNASTSRNAKELDLVITRDAAGLNRAVDPLRPNEAAVASALQTMINNGQPSSLDPLVNALSGLTTDQVNGAMSGLLPAVSGANAQAGMNALRATNNIIQSRVESYRGLSSGDSANERFMWLRALDSSGRQEDRQGISGYKSDMRGLVLGADKPISPRTRVGMAFSSFRGDIRNAGSVAPSSVALDSYQLTGYSSIRTDDRTDVNLQLSLGKNKGASQRLAYAGGTAFANLNGMMVHAGAGVGRMYELGQDASLTPSLRLDYVEVRTDDYAERGATVANLLVNSQKARDLRLTPGVKYVHSFSGGTKFIGNAGLGYDLLNGETLTTASFAGGGPAFVTRAPAQSPWLATAGLALVHEDSKGSEWSLRYDVDSRTSGYRNQSLSVRLRKAF